MDENVFITHLHPGILASQSKLVISTFTSSSLDAAAIGVPVIEYFPLDDKFLKIHPEGSNYANLGILTARNDSEIAGAIEEATSNTYSVPDIFSKLKHQTNTNFITTDYN